MFWLKVVYALLAQGIYTLFYIYINLKNNIIQIMYIYNGSQKEFFPFEKVYTIHMVEEYWLNHPRHCI